MPSALACNDNVFRTHSCDSVGLLQLCIILHLCTARTSVMNSKKRLFNVSSFLFCCGGGDPLQEGGLWKALSSGYSSVLTILGVKGSLSLLCVGW